MLVKVLMIFKKFVGFMISNTQCLTIVIKDDYDLLTLSSKPF